MCVLMLGLMSNSADTTWIKTCVAAVIQQVSANRPAAVQDGTQTA